MTKHQAGEKVILEFANNKARDKTVEELFKKVEITKVGNKFVYVHFIKFEPCHIFSSHSGCWQEVSNFSPDYYLHFNTTTEELIHKRNIEAKFINLLGNSSLYNLSLDQKERILAIVNE